MEILAPALYLFLLLLLILSGVLIQHLNCLNENKNHYFTAEVDDENNTAFDEEYENTYYTPEETISINEKFAAAKDDVLNNNNRLEK